MQKFFYGFISNYDKVFEILAVVLGVIDIIIGLISAKGDDGKKKRKKKYIVVITLFLICSVTAVLFDKFYVEKQTIIPDINNIDYEAAIILLNSNSLKYDLIISEEYEGIEKRYMVVSLSGFEAGDYVPKGSVVVLEVVGSSEPPVPPDPVDITEIELGDEKIIDYYISLERVETYISLYGGSKTPMLSTTLEGEPDRIYLYNVDYEAVVCSYSYEEIPTLGMMGYKFEQIPVGNYRLEIEKEGYIPIKKDFTIYPSEADQNRYIELIRVEPVDEDIMTIFNVYIKDENGNDVSDGHCYFDLINSTDDLNGYGLEIGLDGKVGEYGFKAFSNTKLKVMVMLENDYNIYNAQMIIGDDITYYIVLDKKNGTAKVVNGADYYK